VIVAGPLPGARRRRVPAAADPPVRARSFDSASERAIFIGFNALGDTLCTTPVIRAFRRLHPDAHVTSIVQAVPFTRVLDDNPDIDLQLYSEFLSGYGMTRFSMDWLYSQPLDFSRPSTMYHFDINQVCTTWEAFESHIAAGFARLVQIPIDSVRPIVRIRPEERALAASLVRRPYAVLSMHSNANPRRENAEGRVKDWPFDRWQAVCREIRRQGIEDIVAVGSEFDQRQPSPMWRSLCGLPIKVVAALLESAAVVITLENGIGHLAHAVDAPMVMIYSDIVPLGWANPVEASRAHVLYSDPRKTAVDDVIAAAGDLLAGGFRT
jgi:ADP-heptose:LPS heptosyltransferase